MSNYAFIWDLDGTLFDSYENIVSGLQKTYKELGIETDRDYVMKFVKADSVTAFIKSNSSKVSISDQDLKKRYSEITAQNISEITLMDGALEILKYLKECGINSYVFTHRGATTKPVLCNLGIDSYFTEVITSLDSFKRKPAPDAINYLVEKYDLDPCLTFYVGDRTLDMESANNAGIKKILYLSPDSPVRPSGIEDYVINSLLEIRKLISPKI